MFQSKPDNRRWDADSDKMAALKRSISDLLAKIQPIFNSESISQAEKLENKERLRHCIRDLSSGNLTEQLQLIKSKLEKMLSVLDAMPVRDDDVRYKAPRQKTGEQ